jgi:hypothetical protein
LVFWLNILQMIFNFSLREFFFLRIMKKWWSDLFWEWNYSWIRERKLNHIFKVNKWEKQSVLWERILFFSPITFSHIEFKRWKINDVKRFIETSGTCRIGVLFKENRIFLMLFGFRCFNGILFNANCEVRRKNLYLKRSLIYWESLNPHRSCSYLLNFISHPTWRLTIPCRFNKLSEELLKGTPEKDDK